MRDDEDDGCKMKKRRHYRASKASVPELITLEFNEGTESECIVGGGEKPRIVGSGIEVYTRNLSSQTHTNIHNDCTHTQSAR